MVARSPRVRSARLTDLAALGELSRLSHAPSEATDLPLRSLGLPVNMAQVSVFSLFRLPLGAFRPHDQLYVYEQDQRLAGLVRVERDLHRDEWTIVELDAIDHGEAGDIRFRLVQHLLKDGSKRGATRFHVACADRAGNVELFMQAGFARYGEEHVLYRSPDQALPAPWDADRMEAAGIRQVSPLDALQLARLYRAATPAPVARLEGYRLVDWERHGQWRIPRSSLTPILRLADVHSFVQQAPGQDGDELAAFLRVGVAKEDQPHYLRVMARAEHDAAALIEFGLSVIAREARLPGRAGRFDRPRSERGVMTAVRTYEAPLDRRFLDAGFVRLATVCLLLKENVVRVAEPQLVPAVR